MILGIAVTGGLQFRTTRRQTPTSTRTVATEFNAWVVSAFAISCSRMCATRIKTHHPLHRRRANWPSLSRAELRLLMAGLSDWEARSRGPMRARIRRKRLDAVEFFRRFHGPLADDRLWASASSASHDVTAPPHNPRSERLKGALWHHG